MVIAREAIHPHTTDFSSEIYDLLYSEKDYEGDAAWVTGLIKEWLPSADSLLEVACGTGRYLEQFSSRFSIVDGLDVSPSQLRRAGTRVVPAVTLYQGDMCAFNLGRKYDVTICMFASAGYADTPNKLRGLMESMAQHTNERGIVIIEPFLPDAGYAQDLRRIRHVHTDDGTDVTRLSIKLHDSTLEQAHVLMHYTVERPFDSSGPSDRSGPIVGFAEEHSLGLYSFDTYEALYLDSGLFSRVSFALPNSEYPSVAPVLIGQLA